jgi:hypothetical protein
VDAVTCLLKVHKARIEVMVGGRAKAGRVNLVAEDEDIVRGAPLLAEAGLALGAQVLPLGKCIEAGMQCHAEKLGEGALAHDGPVVA